MSTRPDLAVVIDKVLREQGLTDDPANHEGDIHSWRCSHPDIYGPCSCFADTVRDLAAALNAAIDAWLADEGTREAVARAIDTADECEHERQAWADHDLIYHCPTCRTTAALAALTTPTTTEDHR